MSDFTALLTEWGSKSRAEYGDDLDYPRKAAFIVMAGGSIPLAPVDVDHINRIGRAIRAVGETGSHVIDLHFRRGRNYSQIAQDLSKRANRQVWRAEVERIMDWAIRRAEDNYHRICEPEFPSSAVFATS